MDTLSAEGERLTMHLMLHALMMPGGLGGGGGGARQPAPAML